ncbi:nitrate reductase formation protein NapD [Dyella solisilvae]|uniref:Chaperone NapD n=1 Tax=Dyella solisilvae TaxID=1920168 RepID=A0A370K631_9GAMM|nr:chaperone NapD [Dyella solisilvae]RDI98109.1 nitrate reductase formation protein NapD [Dyella solisilvae]
MSSEQHISSLVVLHRPDALRAVQSFARAHPSLQIAAHGDCRCVVLCETDDQRAVMDLIDGMGDLPGVISVSLIYHHAESPEELDEPVGPVAHT